MPELIVYACPTGDLASQLEDYFLSTQRQVGPNAAHDYMPHCTLTGFFHDESESIPIYAQALTIALEHAQATRPEPVLAIIVMELQPEFHYLQLESHWVQTLIQDFAMHAQSSSRIDAIRLKDWLHLSLAYRFSVEQHASLKAIAEELIQLSAAVSWELRLYERSESNVWQLHLQLPL